MPAKCQLSQSLLLGSGSFPRWVTQTTHGQRQPASPARKALLFQAVLWGILTLSFALFRRKITARGDDVIHIHLMNPQVQGG